MIVWNLDQLNLYICIIVLIEERVISKISTLKVNISTCSVADICFVSIGHTRLYMGVASTMVLISEIVNAFSKTLECGWEKQAKYLALDTFLCIYILMLLYFIFWMVWSFTYSIKTIWIELNWIC